MSPSVDCESTRGRVELTDWEFAKSNLGACVTPRDTQDLDWKPATVPGTVAAELLSGQAIDYSLSLALDDDDYWYRTKFQLESERLDEAQLHFEGLATFTEVWLNDELVLFTDNMFCAHVLDVSQHVKNAGQENWLSIRFCGLTPFLEKKHPRAKWRTPFVEHRNLRFVRTSLIGRTPGLAPQIPVVGPWRPVYLEIREGPALCVNSFSAVPVGDFGVIDVEISLTGVSACGHEDRLWLQCDGQSVELDAGAAFDGSFIARGQLKIDKPKRWWPHTHGSRHTYEVSVQGVIDGQNVSHKWEGIGFRAIELLDPFAICVNGLEIFCRGACWRPLDFLSMNPDPVEMRRILELAVDAGMNMLRITGETAYESGTFYSLCDELGIMVWQDFMFARLDYPVEDEHFLSSITDEATQVLKRLSHHPCLTILCGNTEVSQQAAMLGLDQNIWSNEWFDRGLRSLCEKYAATIPFCRSSPDGGDMPFYTDVGASHYFGVGAYRQEVVDAILHAPSFASECLAFDVPSLGMTTPSVDIDSVVSSPSDAGTNWSFGDITEYYALKVFGADIERLKTADSDRYSLLCGLAVGEVMYAVQSYWRRKGIRCSGSLIIALNDLVGANGWGVIDAQGKAKAPYHFLKRAWQPISLQIVDEGINGLRIIVHNDQSEKIDTTVRLSFCRSDGIVVHSGSVDTAIESNASIELSSDLLVGSFIDSSYVYQFGNKSFDYVLGELFDDSDALISEVIYLLPSSKVPTRDEFDVAVEVCETLPGYVTIRFLTTFFVRSLTVVTEDVELNENCFHMVPNREKFVSARSLNDDEEIKLQLHSPKLGRTIGAVYSKISKITRITN